MLQGYACIKVDTNNTNGQGWLVDAAHYVYIEGKHAIIYMHLVNHNLET